MKKPMIDITPSPIILRTLGEIPFAPWQCLAELVDNSLDAILSADAKGKSIECPTIEINWSRQTAVPLVDKEIVVQDNCHGMSLEQIQDSCRAGYSSNDPIRYLGLFGMGFNIATACLGEETRVLSTKKGDDKWVGIRIDFHDLSKSESFSAPIIYENKDSSDVSGTKIVVRKIKPSIVDALEKSLGRSIQRRLETVYSCILEKEKVQILFQGHRLQSRSHCVWGKERYIQRKNRNIFAVQKIDTAIGDEFFDLSRNRYLSEAESAELYAKIEKGEDSPETIILRPRRLHGWVGVQRFFDTDDYGLDFIRNGRKILVGEKGLFSIEHSETGKTIEEYPIDLGSTVGGRIVGELHVDYLIPTYQKNSFQNDESWLKTVSAIRGEGPLLPKRRLSWLYSSENDSPLGLLVNAFRRTEAGTKNLAVPRDKEKDLLNKFRKSTRGYISDDKWFKTAQEADQKESSQDDKNVDHGEQASDDIRTYADDHLADVLHKIEPKITEEEDLERHSEKWESLSGSYAHNQSPGFEVIAWKTLATKQIRENGVRVPCKSFQDGVKISFFYDETHPLLADYPLTPKQLLLILLAEKFSLRDLSVSLSSVYFGLIENHLQNERILFPVLQEQVSAMLDEIRDALPRIFEDNFEGARKIVQETPGEEEALMIKIVEDFPDLFEKFQKGVIESITALPYVSNEILPKFVKNFPELFFDGEMFILPYQGIDLSGQDATERSRAQIVSKVVSLITDAKDFLAMNKKPPKDELIRVSQSVRQLKKYMKQ